MVVTNNALCPHCARLPDEGGGATRDHIFPNAYGGQRTIVACKDCNSGIGSGVEGKLLGPESLLTLLQQSSGLPHGVLKAKHPLGEFMVDLATGDHSARTSVESLETGPDGVTIVKVFGSPDQVANVRAGLESKYGPLEVLSEEVGSQESKPQLLDVSVSVDTADLRRLIAKTALCALTYLQGDAFVATDLAAWLRQVLDAPREWPASVRRPPQPDPDGEAAIESFDTAETMAKVQARLAKAGLEPLEVAGSTATLVIGAEPNYVAGPYTGFVMSLMGWVVPMGLFAPGVPSNMQAPTFLVQNKQGSITIVDLAQGQPNGYEA